MTRRPLGWLFALALAVGLAAPSRAADPPTAHGAAASGEAAHGAQGDHGGEPESELAVEHGSIFYGLAKAINNALPGDGKVLTGNHFCAWLVILLLAGLSAKATARIRAGDIDPGPPSGLLNFIEYTVEGLTSFVTGIIGPHGAKYVPLVGTFFLFILMNNYLALIPGLLAATSTLNMTLALGITAFCSVQYFGIKENGLKGYLLHFAGSPKDVIGWCMSVLLFPLEVIGELVKPLSLSMRLFGNIFGEDTVVLQIMLFVLGLGGWQLYHGTVQNPGGWWVVALPLQLPMMAFALFGGLIQALVFTMLTCIYISLLTSHDEGHHEHDAPAHH